jgi:hypothetical protein
MLDKIKNEGDWICLSLNINLMVFQVRFKNKLNGFYRQLSGGNQKLIGSSNFHWFHKSFDEGFYRTSIMGTYVHYTFFLKVTDIRKLNVIVRQLVIRTKKLGAFCVNIFDMNNLNYTDTKLLSSVYWYNTYQKVLRTYKIK